MRPSPFYFFFEENVNTENVYNSNLMVTIVFEQKKV